MGTKKSRAAPSSSSPRNRRSASLVGYPTEKGPILLVEDGVGNKRQILCRANKAAHSDPHSRDRLRDRSWRIRCSLLRKIRQRKTLAPLQNGVLGSARTNGQVRLPLGYRRARIRRANGQENSRPALRALLGEALTEAEFKTIKAKYLPLRRASGWVAPEPTPSRSRRHPAGLR
jgi:hypothetical protein